MRPHPSIMHPSAYASFQFELVIISLLNRNSCARSCKHKRRGVSGGARTSGGNGDAPRRDRCRSGCRR